MSPYFRNVALGIILLAVIVTAATSCKKQAVEVKQAEVEPWPIAAITEWDSGDGLCALDWNGPVLALYSDRRLVIKMAPHMYCSASEVSYWTKVLTSEEFARVDEAANEVIRASLLERYVYDPNSFDGVISCFYFGGPQKGVAIDVEGLPFSVLKRANLAHVARLKAGGGVPAALTNYYLVLSEMLEGDLKPWSPAYLIVEFLKENSGASDGCRWPDDWPKPQFSVRHDGDFYARVGVKLDMDKLEQVQKLFGKKALGERMSIEVSGERCFAEYRFYFPGEENWRVFNPDLDLGAVDSGVFLQRPCPKPVCPPPMPPKNAFDFK